MRTRKYGGDREDIDPNIAIKYFTDPETRQPFSAKKIADAVRDVNNTTSSFERYLVNSVGTYNGKEGAKTMNLCNNNIAMDQNVCLQRGARMKKVFQKFARMPPQAYFNFGPFTFVNQGARALGDAGRNSYRSVFGPKRAGTRKRR